MGQLGRGGGARRPWRGTLVISKLHATSSRSRDGQQRGIHLLIVGSQPTATCIALPSRAFAFSTSTSTFGVRARRDYPCNREARRFSDWPNGGKMHALMSSYRLDDKNGSVNRAAALLPKECMLKILDVEMFKCFSGPKSERAVRLAVDWCQAVARQGRILEVIAGFADVPSRTLMHLDENAAESHAGLKDQLRELASRGIGDEDGNIQDLLSRPWKHESRTSPRGCAALFRGTKLSRSA